MKTKSISLVSRILKKECGQTLAFTAVILTAFIGLAGMSLDAGKGYYAYELLKQSTNAATLAGAAGLPDQTLANTYLATYSSTVGDKNAYGIMNSVTTTPTFKCLSQVSKSLNIGCETTNTGGGPYNALQVTQTAKVPTWIGQFFGVPTFNITATSTAAMRGGTDTEYNLAIIIDTTASMASSVNTTSCKGVQIVCAVSGFQSMLQAMDPCALDTSCTTSSYVDSVAMYVFPAVTPGTVAKDYTCPNTNPTIVPYTFPNVTSGSLNLVMPSTYGQYQVTSFSNDYKSTDSTTTLQNDLAKATGYAGTGCAGLQAPGGEGTYYAQVIRQAQADLVTQQAANAGTKNVLIILTDGDATACNSQANSSAGGNNSCGNGSQIVASNCPAVNSSVVAGKTVVTCGSTSISADGKSTTLNCPSGGCTGTPLNGTGTATTNATGYQSPTYPSALGECGQAVEAAQLATKAGTIVYTIGFGTETSGCATDGTYTTSSGSTYGAEAWPSGTGNSKSPCNAIGAMASTVNTFFSDNTGGCPALTTANGAYTKIDAEFAAIVAGLTSSRLIPNGTT
jgi:hypothetical protein